MAASGVYVITKTGTEVFTEILQLIGKLGIGTVAAPEDLDIVKARGNEWLLQLNGPSNELRSGEMMWTRESATLPLSTSSAEYDLKPTGGDLDIQVPSEIISISYRDSNGTDTPLESMTFREYGAIYDKSADGQPSRYYYEKRLSEGKLILDYVPSIADSLIIRYKQPLELIDSYVNEFDIDPAWHRAFLYNVAIDVCPFFDINVDDPKFKTVVTLGAQALTVVNSFSPNSDKLQMRPG
jgi:hypothetical protein